MNRSKAVAAPTEEPGTPTSIPQVTPTAGNQSLLGPEDYQSTFIGKDGQTHTFTYDNAPESEGLLTLALTLDTQEDRDDYAELLKRTGRTSDFSFIVTGYDETTGEPPEGWHIGIAAATNNDPPLHYIYQFDANRDLVIKYRDKNAFDQTLNNPRLSRVYGTKIGVKAIFAAATQEGNDVMTNSEFTKLFGTDEIGLRLYHKMGYNVNGYPSNFAQNAWPTFWTIRRP